MFIYRLYYNGYYRIDEMRRLSPARAFAYTKYKTSEKLTLHFRRPARRIRQSGRLKEAFVHMR